ncbi:MAG: hypothetical protein Ct9H300mP16_07710 [Pseudomonadota bacterium]|nr:MAG: hypothetical protein Ct9H300mP16_07710 [Pseudomonadota bacterium]
MTEEGCATRGTSRPASLNHGHWSPGRCSRAGRKISIFPRVHLGVILEAFPGSPFGLSSYLIRKQNIDILEIPPGPTSLARIWSMLS